jgi:ADP-heptose:LPS heptosyltransferase
LEGFDAVENVLTVGKDAKSRIKTAWQIRRNKYDVALICTAERLQHSLFAQAAQDIAWLQKYQYSFLYNHLLTSSADFWQSEKTIC